MTQSNFEDSEQTQPNRHSESPISIDTAVTGRRPSHSSSVHSQVPVSANDTLALDHDENVPDIVDVVIETSESSEEDEDSETETIDENEPTGNQITASRRCFEGPYSPRTSDVVWGPRHECNPKDTGDTRQSDASISSSPCNSSAASGDKISSPLKHEKPPSPKDGRRSTDLEYQKTLENKKHGYAGSVKEQTCTDTSASHVGKYLEAVMRFGLWIAFSLICVFLSGALGMYLWQWQSSRNVYTTLRAFTHNEVVTNNLNDIQDLTVDNLDMYADATCVEGSSADEMRNALNMQLAKTPDHVRQEIISAAIIDGISTTNSRQDTKADPVNTGKAHSYIAFWTTVYNGRAALHSRYSTCVLSAGVSISVGEELAGFKEIPDRKQIGTEPCKCGYFRCAECPVFQTIVTRTPIFKRHRLTLRNQTALHQWMVKQAVGRANGLLSSRADVRSSLPNQRKAEERIRSIAWRRPEEDVFLGDDKASKESVGARKDEL